VTRFLTVLAMLAATAAYVWLHPPEDLAAGRGILRAVPSSFGPWQGADIDFNDGVAEQLSADDVLLRQYGRDDGAVWLCVVYHQNRRYGAHDPLLCYESQGWLVTAEGRATLDDGSPHGLEVNTFVADRKGRRRVVWYWWTTDGLSTRDAGSFRRRMALLGALENRSWGAFVRVESVAYDGNMNAARARVSDFAGRVARELPPLFARAAQAPRAPKSPAPGS
jgi:EpsI family protein